MNRYKLFIVTKLTFHASILLGGLPPIVANIAGFIPILIHCMILIFIVKKDDSYIKLFAKNIALFLCIALLLPSILQVGILLSIFGVVLSLFSVPYMIKREFKK